MLLILVLRDTLEGDVVLNRSFSVWFTLRLPLTLEYAGDAYWLVPTLGDLPLPLGEIF